MSIHRGACPAVALRVAALVALALLAAGCGRDRQRDIRATILDASGQPLPGAIFYAEAYDESGAFACVTARAGQAGEIPDVARTPLPIPWRANAHLALAAFAPGRRPVILRDPSRRIEADGVVLVFGAPAGEARLGDLGSPFEPGSELRDTISRPSYDALREAFLAAIRLQEGENGPLSAREREQRDALGQIR
jgi:hypothetical protein